MLAKILPFSADDFNGLLLAVAIIFPGALSQIYFSLFVRGRKQGLAQRFFESFCIGIVNFLLVIIPVGKLFDIPYFESVSWNSWILAFFVLVASPYILFRIYLIFTNIFSKRSALEPQSSHDFVFGNHQKKGNWVIAKLKNGSFVGGKFGEKSFAGDGDATGHLVIEESWHFVEGKPKYPHKGSPIIILRPDDYDYILFYDDKAFSIENDEKPAFNEWQSEVAFHEGREKTKC